MHTVGQTIPLIGEFWDMIVLVIMLIGIGLIFHITYRKKSRKEIEKSFGLK